MSPILTVTVNPTVDLAMAVGTLRPVGKNRAQLRHVSAGGGGLNVARAVRELGGRATALHTAGGDVGVRLGHLLEREGLDAVAVRVDPETREAVVLHETEHDRSYHVVPAGEALSAADGEAILAEVAERAAEGGFVVASGSLPPGLAPEFYAELARVVAGCGARFALDTSGPPLRAVLGAGVHLLKPNREEVGELVGHEITSFEEGIGANGALMAQGAAEIVVTTLGRLGAVVSDGHGHTALRAPQHPVVSDAGAGDSFLAATVMALVQGRPPAQAAARGVAAAASAVGRPGVELCRRSEVDELAQRVEVVERPQAAT